ncbi:IS3 family transposase, partial [Pedobacter cryoconitis]
ILDMLNKGFRKIKNHEKPILHSDQGWQYRLEKYKKKLKDKQIMQSMSRKGNCLDNAIIENFFGVLKSELFYLNEYNSVSQLHSEIRKYIKYYNRDRVRLNLNGMSPVKYRTHYLKNIA